MTDTNDLRTIVARAIWTHDSWDDMQPDNPLRKQTMRAADAAIAAATPIIRAQVIEELIAEAESGSATVHAFGHDGPLAEYLRERKNNPQRGHGTEGDHGTH